VGSGTALRIDRDPHLDSVHRAATGGLHPVMAPADSTLFPVRPSPNDLRAVDPRRPDTDAPPGGQRNANALERSRDERHGERRLGKRVKGTQTHQDQARAGFEAAHLTRPVSASVAASTDDPAWLR
jgi:hypothetical protein